ncbi:MAG: 16S rRNA (guanine(966)-N(2))-methyltransferase RsmD [Clostridia bacterium]|nr:16S rRNA (guanine(966)-N(2))-methyltransferase RsmD [Clostridia bacterium]
MRIITGRARGTQLYTLEGEATRPTSERAKEAVFSMLQFCIEGREVLDLFGGSGQMALEAVSRGAAHAYICDNAGAACDIIEKNIRKTHSESNVTLLRTDYTEALRRLRGKAKFDIVFLDPPYNKGLVAAALTQLCELELLKPTSIIVCESGGEDILQGKLGERYEVIRSAKYGIAYVTLLKTTMVTNQ